MIQEEKQLLLKDLCARLPYSIQVYYRIGTNELKGTLTAIYPLDNAICVQIKGYLTRGIECIKPYLRPMSSMTEEEEREFNETLQYTQYTLESYDWLNAHHFDYRGLIPMGLALPAKDGMYNN